MSSAPASFDHRRLRLLASRQHFRLACGTLASERSQADGQRPTASEPNRCDPQLYHVGHEDGRASGITLKSVTTNPNSSSVTRLGSTHVAGRLHSELVGCWLVDCPLRFGTRELLQRVGRHSRNALDAYQRPAQEPTQRHQRCGAGHSQPFSVIAAFHCSPVVSTSSCVRQTWDCTTSSWLPTSNSTSHPNWCVRSLHVASRRSLCRMNNSP
jgi:hypothetical protein